MKKYSSNDPDFFRPLSRKNYKKNEWGRYHESFTSIFRARVRSFFGNRCVACGRTAWGNRKPLQVHHVDFNIWVDCEDANALFVALCHECHNRAHRDPMLWRRRFHIIIAELAGGRCCYTAEEWLDTQQRRETRRNNSDNGADGDDLSTHALDSSEIALLQRTRKRLQDMKVDVTPFALALALKANDHDIGIDRCREWLEAEVIK
jgi:hypothetical protein